MIKLKRPSKKVLLSVLASVLFIGLIVGGYQGLKAINHFFSLNELQFNRVVEIRFNKPVKIVSKEELKKEAEFNQQVDEVVEKAVEIYLSPTPKKETSLKLVKEVQATSYTYPNHAHKPFYNEVMAGIKARTADWENFAELEALEGGFDPGAINPTSGACGLWQSSPCSKMDCPLNESGIDCQLDWGINYVEKRYGTPKKALEFWRSRVPINGKDVGNWF